LIEWIDEAALVLACKAGAAFSRPQMAVGASSRTISSKSGENVHRRRVEYSVENC
jgi:hypothetical protein